jgi:hypothetical protein
LDGWRSGCASAEPLEESNQGVDQILQEVSEHAPEVDSVEQAGDCTEQVAQQVAGPGYGGDVEDYLVQVHLEAQQIKV